MKILLVEDDIIMADIISEYLIQKNFIIINAYNGEQAEELIYSNIYDIILMDINIPRINGLEIAKKMKELGYKIPIIFISNSFSIEEFNQAYLYGANDFLRKPFILDELLVRIFYIKEHFLIESNEGLTITKDIIFNFVNMSIERNNKIFFIPKKEAEVLRYLLLNKNRVISINELILNIWGYDDNPSISTIRTYIKNIRKYINKEILVTVKGLGYILKI